MIDVAAVLLAAGTGSSDVSPLNAFDAALHDGGGAALSNINLVKVTSIVPPGARIVRLREGAGVDAQGLLAHAVISSICTEKDEVVSAGTVAAAPLDPAASGMIFEAHGKMSAATCTANMVTMVTEGMTLREAAKWETFTAAAETKPVNALTGHKRYRCAVAVAVFLDHATVAKYSEALVPA